MTEPGDASAGLPSLTNDYLWIGNGSSVATAVQMSGDCTIANAGAITCTKTSGTLFGSLATLSAAPAGTLTGTMLASNVTASSLTGVGTITSGVWNGTGIGIAHGGTNATSQTTNGVNYFNGTSITSDSGFLYSGGNILLNNSGGYTQIGNYSATTVPSLYLSGYRPSTWSANTLSFGDELNNSRYFMNTRGTNENNNADWMFLYYNTGSGSNSWQNILGVYPTSLNAQTYSETLHDGTLSLNSDGSATFGGLVSGVTPTASANLATKAYVDTAVAGAGGSGAPVNFQVFTASGTWTNPGSGSMAHVECWGGGGGGGGSCGSCCSGLACMAKEEVGAAMLMLGFRYPLSRPQSPSRSVVWAVGAEAIVAEAQAAVRPSAAI